MFQYYANSAHQPHPLGLITLSKFFNKIKSPKQETIELLKNIQIASKKGDKELKAKLKEHLYAFTPSVIVNKRRAYDNIKTFTGLTVLDFDKIDYAIEFKEHLFHTYKSVIGCWISPSGMGVKAIVKIPVVTSVDEYKSYFYGLASEMEIYKGFDFTTQNPTLLLFISYDKDILLRNDYIEWNIKGKKINEFSKSIAPIHPPHKITHKQTEWVINWYTKKINDIVDMGHPQVRDNSVTLGGYVGSGYIDYMDAIMLSEYLISVNAYLQKNIKGYQRTARESINLGMTKPLTFDKHGRQ